MLNDGKSTRHEPPSFLFSLWKELGNFFAQHTVPVAFRQLDNNIHNKVGRLLAYGKKGKKMRQWISVAVVMGVKKQELKHQHGKRKDPLRTHQTRLRNLMLFASKDIPTYC